MVFGELSIRWANTVKSFFRKGLERPDSSVSCVTGNRQKYEDVASQPPDDLTEQQLRALKAAAEAESLWAPKYGTVRVGRLLKTHLAKWLPELTHEERKAVFGSLVRDGIVRTIPVKGKDKTFSQYRVIWEHPRVRSLVRDGCLLRKEENPGPSLDVPRALSAGEELGLILSSIRI